MKKRVISPVLAVGIIIVLIVLFVIFSAFIFKNMGSLNPPGECQSDSDCVKVQVGCCPCSSGGGEKCVPISEKGKYEEELGKCDKGIFCAQVYNCNISECECKEGRCQG